jgi:hypothetical protein
MARVKGKGRVQGDCERCLYNLDRQVKELVSESFTLPVLALDPPPVVSLEPPDIGLLLRERKERRTVYLPSDGRDVEVDVQGFLNAVKARRLEGGGVVLEFEWL